jgi:ribonuclease-3
MNLKDEELPYNLKNIRLEPQDLNVILLQFDTIEFFDINFYRRAFIHKSYITRKNENYENGNKKCPHHCMPLQEESSERMEFLGDSILNLTVAKYVFERYPEMNEGFLTNMRTKLVNGKMLAYLSSKVNFNKYLIISKQIDENDGRQNKNILEDAFESFIGAIFIDHNEKNGNGFQIAEKWIISVIEKFVDFSELIHKVENFKDTIIKYCQHTFHWIPRFYEVDIEEIKKKKIHTVCVKNDKLDIIGIGKGINRKTAEIDAAQEALHFYGYFKHK